MIDSIKLSTTLLIKAVLANPDASPLELDMADRLQGQRTEISLLTSQLALARSAATIAESKLVLAEIQARSRSEAGNDQTANASDAAAE